MRESVSSLGWAPKIMLTVLFAALLFPLVSMAQDVPFGEDPMAVAQVIWDAVVSKGPNAVFVILVASLVLAVWAFRKYGKSLSAKFLPKLAPKIAAVLDNPIVAYCLPVVFSICAAMITAMKAGHPFWPDAVREGFKVGVTAVWAFVGAKKVQEVRAAAQVKAAAAVKDEGPLSVFRNGPQP